MSDTTKTISLESMDSPVPGLDCPVETPSVVDGTPGIVQLVEQAAKTGVFPDPASSGETKGSIAGSKTSKKSRKRSKKVATSDKKSEGEKSTSGSRSTVSVEIAVPSKEGFEECRDLVVKHGYRYVKVDSMSANEHYLPAVTRSLATAKCLQLIRDDGVPVGSVIVDIYGNDRTVGLGKQFNLDVKNHRPLVTQRDVARGTGLLTMPERAHGIIAIDDYDLEAEELASFLRLTTGKTAHIALMNTTGRAGLTHSGAFYHVGGDVISRSHPEDAQSFIGKDAQWLFNCTPYQLLPQVDRKSEYLTINFRRTVGSYIVFAVTLKEGRASDITCATLPLRSIPVTEMIKVRGEEIEVVAGVLSAVADSTEQNNMSERIAKRAAASKMDQHPGWKKFKTVFPRGGASKFIQQIEHNTAEYAYYYWREQSIHTNYLLKKWYRFADYMAVSNSSTHANRGQSVRRSDLILQDVRNYSYGFTDIFYFLGIALSILGLLFAAWKIHLILNWASPLMASTQQKEISIFDLIKSTYARNGGPLQMDAISNFLEMVGVSRPSESSVQAILGANQMSNSEHMAMNLLSFLAQIVKGFGQLTKILYDGLSLDLEMITFTPPGGEEIAMAKLWVVAVATFTNAALEEGFKRYAGWWIIPTFEIVGKAILAQKMNNPAYLAGALLGYPMHYLFAKVLSYIPGTILHFAWNMYSIHCDRASDSAGLKYSMFDFVNFCNYYYSFNVEEMKLSNFSEAGMKYLYGVDTNRSLPIPPQAAKLHNAVETSDPNQFRQRIFYIAGVLAPLYRPNQSAVNLTQAMQMRVLVENENPAPAKYWKLLGDYFHSIVQFVPKYISIEEIMANVKTSARKRLERATRNIINGRDPYEIKMEYMVKADEIIGLKPNGEGGYDLKPRAICNVNPEVQLLLQEAVRSTFGGLVAYLLDRPFVWRGKSFTITIPYGWNTEQLTEGMAKALEAIRGGLDFAIFVFGDDGMAFTRDGYLFWDLSHNDRSHTSDIQEVFTGFVDRFFPKEAEFLRELAAFTGRLQGRRYKRQPGYQWARKTRTVQQLGDLRYVLDNMTRPLTLEEQEFLDRVIDLLDQLGSGWPNTSASNSIGNGVASVEALSVIDRRSFVDTYTALGYKCKYFECDFYQLEFLKMMPAPTVDGGFRMMPFPSRIGKLGKVLEAPNVIAKGEPNGLESLKAVAYMLYQNYKGVPISWPVLGPLVQRLFEFSERTGTLKNSDPYVIEVEYGADLDYHKCRAVVCDRYDLTLEELDIAELVIETMPIPGVVAHPLLTKIILRDY